MQIRPPLRTIGHIINDAMIGDKLSGAALAGVALQFHLCNDDVWDVHARNYTWSRESKSPDFKQCLETLIPIPDHQKNLLHLCRRFSYFIFRLFFFDDRPIRRCSRYLENLLDEII
jgi:hypothetical protein